MGRSADTSSRVVQKERIRIRSAMREHRPTRETQSGDRLLVEDQTYIVIVFLDCELNLLNAIIFMLSRLNDVLVKY